MTEIPAPTPLPVLWLGYLGVASVIVAVGVEGAVSDRALLAVGLPAVAAVAGVTIYYAEVAEVADD